MKKVAVHWTIINIQWGLKWIVSRINAKFRKATIAPLKFSLPWCILKKLDGEMMEHFVLPNKVLTDIAFPFPKQHLDMLLAPDTSWIRK